MRQLRLIVSVARGYVGYGIDMEELVQEGNLGLMRAVDLFRAQRGCRFSTYAVHWIRQAILRALLESGRAIRLPVRFAENLFKASKTSQRFLLQNGREPSEGELAAATQREVIAKLHGLDGQLPRSDKALAKELGLTTAKIHRAKGKALRKLRHPKNKALLP